MNSNPYLLQFGDNHTLLMDNVAQAQEGNT